MEKVILFLMLFMKLPMSFLFNKMEMNYKKLSWCSFEHEKSKQRCEESKYKIHTRQSPLKGAYARKAHTAKKVNG